MDCDMKDLMRLIYYYIFWTNINSGNGLHWKYNEYLIQSIATDLARGCIIPSLFDVVGRNGRFGWRTRNLTCIMRTGKNYGHRLIRLAEAERENNARGVGPRNKRYDFLLRVTSSSRTSTFARSSSLEVVLD